MSSARAPRLYTHPLRKREHDQTPGSKLDLSKADPYLRPTQ
jgi:hypothetical protein